MKATRYAILVAYFVFRNVSITTWSLSTAVIDCSDPSDGSGIVANAARGDDRKAVRSAREERRIIVTSGCVTDEWKITKEQTHHSQLKTSKSCFHARFDTKMAGTRENESARLLVEGIARNHLLPPTQDLREYDRSKSYKANDTAKVCTPT